MYYLTKTKSPAGLLQIQFLPIIGAVLEDLTMTFITALPKLQIFKAIIAVLDKLSSKYAHFILHMSLL